MASLFERLKGDCAADWDDYTRHAFVEQMGNGQLPLKAFQDYLEQDYLFLIQFARAYALSIYKSRSLAEMRGGLEGLKAILDVAIEAKLTETVAEVIAEWSQFIRTAHQCRHGFRC